MPGWHHADAAEFGIAFWTRGQDTTGTRAMLTSPLVEEVQAELFHGPAFPATDQDLPPGTMMVRLTAVSVIVLQRDHVAWAVTHLQDLAFRRGRAEAGEDTTRWFCLEWTERPQPGAPLPGETSLAAVSEITWGGLKRLYLPSPVVGPLQHPTRP